MSKPIILDNPLYVLLRADDMAAFNAQRPEGPLNLQTANLRGCDLRGVNLTDVDLSDAYFRNADMRGVDLSRTDLHGASLASANVSGVLFPQELSAAEIRLSIEQGTRLRY